MNYDSSQKYEGITNSVLDLVGNTPLLALDRIWPGPGRLLAKCEFLNPTGSLKDRSAYYMIDEAERLGILKPEQKVVEMTSGNQGCGLAMVCNIKKHPFTALMSKGNSEQRRIMMKGLSANLLLVDQVNGIEGSVTEDDNMALQEFACAYVEQHPEEYVVNQGDNQLNILAHYKGTGPEIWKQTQGKIDAFCTVIGTSGTLMGISQFFHEQNSNIKSYCVEPLGCEPIRGLPITKPIHLLQGSSYGFSPPMFDYKYINGTITVSEDEILETRKRLGKEEGLFLGYTSAGNVAAAINLLKSGELKSDSTVVTILCDTGLKYPA